jgi:hypothetical protein
MADSDKRGTDLAQKVRNAERRLQQQMSRTIVPGELEKARRNHREALAELQAWNDGRAYGSGTGDNH